MQKAQVYHQWLILIWQCYHLDQKEVFRYVKLEMTLIPLQIATSTNFWPQFRRESETLFSIHTSKFFRRLNWYDDMRMIFYQNFFSIFQRLIGFFLIRISYVILCWRLISINQGSSILVNLGNCKYHTLLFWIRYKWSSTYQKMRK